MCENIDYVVGNSAKACSNCLNQNNTVFCGNSCFLNHNMSISSALTACAQSCKNVKNTYETANQCPSFNIQSSVVIIAAVVLLCPVGVFVGYLLAMWYARTRLGRSLNARANSMLTTFPVPLAHVVVSTEDDEDIELSGGRILPETQLAEATFASSTVSANPTEVIISPTTVDSSSTILSPTTQASSISVAVSSPTSAVTVVAVEREV